MSEMVRVGIGNNGFSLMHLATGQPPTCIYVTPEQAADLYAQLGNLLPDELLNTEPFASDELDPEPPEMSK